MKPILFNTDMVKAIMEGRKTVTRRVVKPRYRPDEVAFQIITNARSGKFVGVELLDEYEEATRYMPQPFYEGDILYVREAWAEMHYGYVYRADGETPEGWDASDRWRPSIHMPKEAARAFLRVSDVRVERLQDMHEKYPPGPDNPVVKEGFLFLCDFIATWQNTINPADIHSYGWEANPWVWVIEFERCAKPEAEEG